VTINQINEHYAFTIEQGYNMIDNDAPFMSTNPELEIVPAKLQKQDYVKSKTLQVTDKVVSGWLRRSAVLETTSAISLIFTGTPFPLNFFILKRTKGTLFIFDKPGGAMLARIDQKNILYSKVNKKYEGGEKKSAKHMPNDFCF
jgi:hypothetical protein